MTVLITGATGQVGGAAARALAAEGVAVRALVRDPRHAIGLDGIALVQGSFEDGAALESALQGVETLFLMGRDGPDVVAQLANGIDCAEAAGVAHIVKLSAIGADPYSPLELMRDHQRIDERLRAGNAAWTLIQPHLFMQNLLRAADEVRRDGRLIAPMAHAAIPLVDTHDVGLAAAAILKNPAPHAGKTYRLTGPEALTYDQVAAALTALIGRAVAYEPFSAHDYESRLRSAEVDGQRAFDLAHILLAYAPDDMAVTPDFEALTGRKPTALADFLAGHRGRFAG